MKAIIHVYLNIFLSALGANRYGEIFILFKNSINHNKKYIRIADSV
jgi:hypothetical protein